MTSCNLHRALPTSIRQICAGVVTCAEEQETRTNNSFIRRNQTNDVIVITSTSIVAYFSGDVRMANAMSGAASLGSLCG